MDTQQFSSERMNSQEIKKERIQEMNKLLNKKINRALSICKETIHRVTKEIILYNSPNIVLNIVKSVNMITLKELEEYILNGFPENYLERIYIKKNILPKIKSNNQRILDYSLEYAAGKIPMLKNKYLKEIQSENEDNQSSLLSFIGRTANVTANGIGKVFSGTADILAKGNENFVKPLFNNLVDKVLPNICRKDEDDDFEMDTFSGFDGNDQMEDGFVLIL